MLPRANIGGRHFTKARLNPNSARKAAPHKPKAVAAPSSRTDQRPAHQLHFSHEELSYVAYGDAPAPSSTQLLQDVVQRTHQGTQDVSAGATASNPASLLLSLHGESELSTALGVAAAAAVVRQGAQAAALADVVPVPDAVAVHGCSSVATTEVAVATSSGVRHRRVSSSSNDGELQALLHGAPGTNSIRIGSIPIPVPQAAEVHAVLPMVALAAQALSQSASSSSISSAVQEEVVVEVEQEAAAGAVLMVQAQSPVASTTKLSVTSAEFVPQAQYAAAAAAGAEDEAAPTAAASTSEGVEAAPAVPLLSHATSISSAASDVPSVPSPPHMPAWYQPPQQQYPQPYMQVQQPYPHPQQYMQPWMPPMLPPYMQYPPFPPPHMPYMQPQLPFMPFMVPHMQQQYHHMQLPYEHQQQHQTQQQEAEEGQHDAQQQYHQHEQYHEEEEQHQQQQQRYVPRAPSSVAGSVANSSASRYGADSSTVTVSGHSAVKDAAGAVAKVLQRQGTCLLVALRRANEAPADATHIAAKTLAVSRFYINAHMAAAGAAGAQAARALAAAVLGSGMEQQQQQQVAAVTDSSAREEVTFIPFNRRAGRQQDPEAFGFVVFRSRADELSALLPPPVGAPMAKQQQQQQQVDGGSGTGVAPPLLKAGGGTDVNKLSNAIIHNVLERGQAALQLAGANACHVAMRALVKARARLGRKFNTGVTTSASFTTEDTSGALGRSTVFLRLDVVRCALEGPLAGWGEASPEAAGWAQELQLA